MRARRRGRRRRRARPRRSPRSSSGWRRSASATRRLAARARRAPQRPAPDGGGQARPLHGRVGRRPRARGRVRHVRRPTATRAARRDLLARAQRVQRQRRAAPRAARRAAAGAGADRVVGEPERLPRRRPRRSSTPSARRDLGGRRRGAGAGADPRPPRRRDRRHRSARSSPPASRCSSSRADARAARAPPRAVLGGFELCSHAALERDPRSPRRDAHVVAARPAAAGPLLAARTHDPSGVGTEPSCVFAEQIHEREYALRGALTATYRALRAAGGARAASSRRCCAATRRRPRSPARWPDARSGASSRRARARSSLDSRAARVAPVPPPQRHGDLPTARPALPGLLVQRASRTGRIADRSDGKGGVRAPARQRPATPTRVPVDGVELRSSTRRSTAPTSPTLERSLLSRPLRDRRGARRRRRRRRSTASGSRTAFVFACEHHADQRRKSGEDFIVHPVGVAKICAGMRLDTETLCAALLHDTVEDTSASLDEVRERFGDEIADARRRRHEAHRHHLPVARRGAGRELPQDDGRDGHGRPGHPHQARRPPAQHAHDRRDAQAEADRQGEGDARDLRADRAPPRHPRDQVGARGPRVRRRCTRASTRRSRAWSTSSARSASATSRRPASTCTASCEALGIEADDLRPREALLLDLLEDDQEGPRVQRDLRPHGDAGRSSTR